MTLTLYVSRRSSPPSTRSLRPAHKYDAPSPLARVLELLVLNEEPTEEAVVHEI